jgi:probable HAF family extracellular repeat protein
MKRMLTLLIFGLLLFSASTGSAQMYTVSDLNSNTGLGKVSQVNAVNNFGQVVGNIVSNGTSSTAFRTAPNSAISLPADDIGGLEAFGINDSGQVVGEFALPDGHYHAFRTHPNNPVNPASDDLGAIGDTYTTTYAMGVNAFGQVVGSVYSTSVNAYRTAPNAAINPETDIIGTLGGTFSVAQAINDSGQVVGRSYLSDNVTTHAFRTAPNLPINPFTDDLGTLGGLYSSALGINAFGQVVGWSTLTGGYEGVWHAFLSAPNSPINPATDDLGVGMATAVNDYGQVVGSLTAGAFLYSNGVVHFLNSLIPTDSMCEVRGPRAINNLGQIASQGVCNGEGHSLLLTPIYKGSVQQPINADGSSIFNANRGVVRAKFTLTQYDQPICPSLPATIAITRTAGGTLGSVDESTIWQMLTAAQTSKLLGASTHTTLQPLRWALARIEWTSASTESSSGTRCLRSSNRNKMHEGDLPAQSVLAAYNSALI